MYSGPRAKNPVSNTLIMLGAVLCWALCAPSSTAHANAGAANPRLITVNGEAEERVAPDMATLRMDVMTDDKEAAKARKEADAITSKALAIIRAQGILDADVDSTGLSISPKYRWIKATRVQELTGYQVSRSIEVRLLDLDRLGALLENLSDAGVNRVHPPQLGLVDDEALYQKALAAAARNARDRAEIIASTLGERVSAVQQANVYDNGPRPVERFASRAVMASDMAENSPGESYNSGHITYRVGISVSFLLE